MRLFIALLAVLGMVIAGAGTTAAAAGDGYVLAASQQQPAQPGGGEFEVQVDVGQSEGGGAWFADPIWIAIGVIGVVLLIVIVALAARGGGTTVIRD